MNSAWIPFDPKLADPEKLMRAVRKLTPDYGRIPIGRSHQAPLSSFAVMEPVIRYWRTAVTDGHDFPNDQWKPTETRASIVPSLVRDEDRFPYETVTREVTLPSSLIGGDGRPLRSLGMLVYRQYGEMLSNPVITSRTIPNPPEVQLDRAELELTTKFEATQVGDPNWMPNPRLIFDTEDQAIDWIVAEMRSKPWGKQYAVRPIIVPAEGPVREPLTVVGRKVDPVDVVFEITGDLRPEGPIQDGEIEGWRVAFAEPEPK